ncbi:MAG: hypothetical protein HPY64_15470 [Anaerolineae bacterium]|nr:hypothetical protein [Anaerolineae bacterium]
MAISSAPQDAQIANFLMDYVEGTASLSALLRRYNLTYAEIADLVALSDRLRAALVEVTPSEAFVKSLYNELVLQRRQTGRGWWSRVALSVPRRIPPMSNRTKIAAGIGGLTLFYLTARSLSHLLSNRQRDETTREMVA